MNADADGTLPLSGDLANLASAFGELGELLRRPGRSPLDALVAVCLDRVPGTEAASVTTLVDGTFHTAATTDEWATQADLLQYALGSGPCVDAIVADTIYRPDDLQHDPRWPEFGRRVSAELGVQSMLSFRMHLEATATIAGLNLYARRPAAFGEEATVIGLLLATHGAVAVTAAQHGDRVANLEQALVTNRDIGTAVGIIMALHKVTRQQAFDLLAVASQRANLKLQVVAERVVATGALELAGGSGRAPLRRQPRG